MFDTLLIEVELKATLWAHQFGTLAILNQNTQIAFLVLQLHSTTPSLHFEQSFCSPLHIKRWHEYVIHCHPKDFIGKDLKPKQDISRGVGSSLRLPSADVSDRPKRDDETLRSKARQHRLEGTSLGVQKELGIKLPFALPPSYSVVFAPFKAFFLPYFRVCNDNSLQTDIVKC